MKGMRRPTCGGRGIVTCQRCKGYGEINSFPKNITCNVCGGTGQVKCPNCGGTGEIQAENL